MCHGWLGCWIENFGGGIGMASQNNRIDLRMEFIVWKGKFIMGVYSFCTTDYLPGPKNH